MELVVLSLIESWIILKAISDICASEAPPCWKLSRILRDSCRALSESIWSCFFSSKICAPSDLIASRILISVSVDYGGLECVRYLLIGQIVLQFRLGFLLTGVAVLVLLSGSVEDLFSILHILGSKVEFCIALSSLICEELFL